MATKTFSSVKLPNNDVGVIAIPYGTCGTAAATAAKTVTVKNFVLETGASIRVKFTHKNTASNPTLNVNSLGAKAIYWHGSKISETEYWEDGAIIEFVYNGTQWEIVGSTALVANLVNGAPETLDTLNEIAAALENNKDIVTVLRQAIDEKADKTELATTNANVAANKAAIEAFVPITAEEINNLFK